MNRSDEIVVCRNSRPQDAGKTSKSHGNSSDGPGLNNGKKSPAKEESDNRRERLAQIDVHASSSWHHRRQLAIGERGGDREDGGHTPSHQQPSGAANVARHVGRDDKNSRA